MSILVVPILRSQWSIIESSKQSSGTRIYLDKDNHPRGDEVGVAESLPELGDSWDRDHDNLKLHTIAERWMDDSGICGKTYTLSYGVDTGSGDFENPEDLTTNINLSGSFGTYSSTDTAWKWSSDDTDLPADTRVPLREFNEVVELKREVHASDFMNFNNIISLKVGKVNENEFLNAPTGHVLFEGCSAQEVRPEFPELRKWVVRLQFNIRKESWQKIYRPDTGSYDTPVVGTDTYLYECTDFTTLLTTDHRPLYPPRDD